jgi:hypothetical protein
MEKENLTALFFVFKHTVQVKENGEGEERSEPGVWIGSGQGGQR